MRACDVCAKWLMHGFKKITVTVDEKGVDPQKELKVVTHHYIANGFKKIHFSFIFKKIKEM